MLKKMLSVTICVLIAVSMFSMLNVAHAQQGITESTLYTELSKLSVKLYYWQNGGWTYLYTRDFKYLTSWYAKKWLYTSGNTCNDVLNFNNSQPNYDCDAVESNDTNYYVGYLNVGFEETGSACGYDALTLSIAYCEAINNSSKKVIFLEVVMGYGSYKKEIYCEGHKIFDYSTDIQKDCYHFRFYFVDTIYNAIPLDGGGGGVGGSGSDDYLYSSASFPSVDDLSRRLGIEVRGYDGSQWVHKYDRYHIQELWTLSYPIVNLKWYVQYLSYYSAESSGNWYYAKRETAFEDHWNQTYGMHDNVLDVLMVCTYWKNKVNATSWYNVYKIESIHLTGSLNCKVFFETNGLGQGGWQCVFLGWEANPIQRYAWNIILKEWYSGS